MQIGSQNISGENRTFVIAEIGQAHDGSLGTAHAYIDAVADAGADAVKFQTHLAIAESTLDESFRIALSGQDETRWDYWKRMEFKVDEWVALSAHACDRGLVFLSSPFSIEAIELLSGIGMQAWKVGSGEAFNWNLIEAMLKVGGPILLSTGMSSWSDIEDTVERIKKRGGEAALFQCTTRYPTALEEVGLNVLEDLRKDFGLPVGLSDHSGTIYPSLAAMANKVDLIEVHVTFDRRMYGPDNSSSVTVDELKLICDSNEAFATLRRNPVDKNVAAQGLAPTKALFTKSLSLVCDLPAGSVLSAELVTLKKPSGGLPWESLPSLVGKRLRKAVSANRLLRLDDFE